MVENNLCRGFLLFNRVVIVDKECANKIYWNGYYGSFLGVPKPKKKNIESPLELSLLEALYLLSKNRLIVLSGDREVSYEELLDYSAKVIPRFKELYIVYRDLREKGFVVRRGLKFGCDYLVYEYGPGIDHAPWGVQVFREDEELDPIDLVRMGRLLHSVRKKLILAITNPEKSNVKYIKLEWWRP